MPEHLKALVVIAGASFFAFWLARQPLAESYQAALEYRRDRSLWFVMTLAAFLFPNYWLLILISTVVCLVQSGRHSTPIALYALLLLVLPQLDHYLPESNPKFMLNQARIYGLALLGPVAIKLLRSSDQPPSGSKAVDTCVVLLIIWMALIQGVHESVTGFIKGCVFHILDVWLPYYVASRGLRSQADFKRLAATIIVGSLALALIAVLEAQRGWLLYSRVKTMLGAESELYLLRSEGGPLRANATLGNIPLGYVMSIAIGMLALVWGQNASRWKLFFIAGALIAGLIAPLSRGPWVGAAAMAMVLVLLGPGLGRRLKWAIPAGICATLVLLMSPAGKTIVELLPFVGTVKADTVDYRTRLFTVSMEVFKQNPVIGDYNFLANPMMEQMRQGQGIIDMVNTYLQFAMPYGSVGLLLFVCIFIGSLQACRRTRKLHRSDPEIELTGRVLIAVVVGMLVTIATVSSVTVVPYFYWMMAGVCMAYARTNRSVANEVLARRPSFKAQVPARSALPSR